MSPYYQLESEHALDEWFQDLLNPMREYLKKGEIHLLQHEGNTIHLQADALFDEEDFLLVDEIFPLFSDALYQRIRTLIAERAESYFMPGSIMLIFEGRNYGYVPVVPIPIHCFRQDGSFNPASVGYLPLFWGGDQLCCTELCAKRLMAFHPHGLVIKQFN